MGDSVIARGAEIGSVLAKSVYAAGYGKKERACKFPVCSCEIGYPQGTPSLGGAAGQLLSNLCWNLCWKPPMPAPKFGTGQPVTRKEDDALLRGAGRYVADHAPAGCLHAVVLRSPHAHARFRITDIAKARAMPGVALVLTGADTATLGTLPCQGEVPGCTIEAPPYAILAQDEVRHVGDAVAFVVANTIERARDAAEAITIDWEPLPAVIGATRALAPDAPKVW